MMQTISILIPCYNESTTLLKVITQILASPIALKKEIIVIDDGSNQKTKTVIDTIKRSKLATVISYPKNKGKGYAIRQGLAVATGDILLIQDADLEYSPTDYPKLLAPLLEGKSNVVYGSRFTTAPNTKKNRGYRINFIGNKTLTALCNLVTKHTLTDMETGYKVFKKSVYTRLNLKENRFGIEPEITIKLSKLGISITEIPINYHARTHQEGKKIKWQDGLSAMRCILKYAIVPYKG